jgi:hypothetical protein
LLNGLALEKQSLDAKIAAVNAALGKGRPGRKPKAASADAESAPAAAGPKKKRTLSAAARARIAAAQKKRWANFRKAEAAS